MGLRLVPLLSGPLRSAEGKLLIFRVLGRACQRGCRRFESGLVLQIPLGFRAAARRGVAAVARPGPWCWVGPSRASAGGLLLELPEPFRGPMRAPLRLGSCRSGLRRPRGVPRAASPRAIRRHPTPPCGAPPSLAERGRQRRWRPCGLSVALPSGPASAIGSVIERRGWSCSPRPGSGSRTWGRDPGCDHDRGEGWVRSTSPTSVAPRRERAPALREGRAPGLGRGARVLWLSREGAAIQGSLRSMSETRTAGSKGFSRKSMSRDPIGTREREWPEITIVGMSPIVQSRRTDAICTPSTSGST